MNRNRCIPVWCAILALVASSCLSKAHAQGVKTLPEKAAPGTRELIIEGIKRNFEQLRAIRSLSVSYRLRYENLAGRRNFGFDEAQLWNMSKGEMIRTEIRSIRKGDRPQEDHRISTWNTKVGIQGTNDVFYVIKNTPGSDVNRYRFYFDYMCLPLGSARAIRGSREPAGARGDYWIPDALIRFAKDYRVAPEMEKTGSVPCYLLERPGRDRLWVDPTKNHSVLRRDVFFPGSDRLWERTSYRDHKQLAGYWFPTLIVREEFGGPDQASDLTNKICHRKTIDQVDVSIATLPDEEFSCQIPTGTRVIDTVRGISYNALPAGDDGIQKTVDQARQFKPSTRRFFVLVVGNVLLFILLGLLILIRRRSSLRQGPMSGPDLPRPEVSMGGQSSRRSDDTLGTDLPSFGRSIARRRHMVAFTVVSFLILLIAVFALRRWGREVHLADTEPEQRAAELSSLQKQIEQEKRILAQTLRAMETVKDSKTLEKLKYTRDATESDLESLTKERSRLQR